MLGQEKNTRVSMFRHGVARDVVHAEECLISTGEAVISSPRLEKAK